MQVVVEEELKLRPDLQPAVADATALLEAELGPYAPVIQACWSLAPDNHDRTFMELRLADRTGSVSYRFAPEEMASRNHMKVRLHRLWGDFLQVRSHVQLDGMLWDLSKLEAE